MIYNRLLSKYFFSPGKQRLFFYFKWRKAPATQYSRTPVGLGFYLITWAGVCSHIYCPLSPLLLGTGCQFPRCCLRPSNTQIQSSCWITSGVEQRWQIMHFLFKLTLTSSCFPCMLHSGCWHVLLCFFSWCKRWLRYQPVYAQREDSDLRNSFQFTWLLASPPFLTGY